MFFVSDAVEKGVESIFFADSVREEKKTAIQVWLSISGMDIA